MTEALEQEIRTLRSLFESPRDPEGRVFAPLADAHRRAGAIQEAVRLLNEGLARHPAFVPGHVVAAQLYVEQGLIEEAGLAAKAALDLDSENVNALKSLLRVHGEKGEDREAEQVRARLLALEPDFGDVAVTAAGGVPEAGFDRGYEGVIGLEELAPEPRVDASEGVGLLPSEGDTVSATDSHEVDLLDTGWTEPGSAPEPDVDEAGFDSPLPDLAPSFAEEEAVDLGALAPDPEPAVEDAVDLAALAPDPEPAVEDAVDLAALAPDPEPAVEDAVDLAALAPDADPALGDEPSPVTPQTRDFATGAAVDASALPPDSPLHEPVFDLDALAPDPEGLVEDVADIGALAPDREAGPEAAVELRDLAPDPVLEEPVLDLDALGPDSAPEGVMDLESLAPGTPDETDEPVIDLDALAPEPAAPIEGAAVGEPFEEVGPLAPGGSDPFGDTSPAGAVDDHEETGAPIYTRTLGDLYVEQGALDRALEVFRHLLNEDPTNSELAARIDELETGGTGAPSDEATETLARDLAESDDGGHEVDSPFAWAGDDAGESEGSGPSIGDYFQNLLGWEPRGGP